MLPIPPDKWDTFSMQTWEEAYVPWHNCRINKMYNVWNVSPNVTNEVYRWASRNLIGRYELTVGTGYFEFEEDKVLFVLRWL